MREQHFSLKQMALWSILCAAVFETTEVRAHGGGGNEAPAKKETKVKTELRSTPSIPNALNYAELNKIISQDKNPHDVAIVRCTLNSYASCRGLQIALYDMKGKQILVGNTGSEGLVGFEGLKEGEQYEARIEASKYQGKIVVTPGNAWTLNADRIVD